MPCSRCKAPNADMFSPTGESVCRFCFNTEQNAQADARARASLERDAPPGFKAADSGAPPPIPRTMIGQGLAVMGFAVLFALGTLVLFDCIYPIWVGLLLLGGGTHVARGLVLARRLPARSH
jgi:hypothetical protein